MISTTYLLIINSPLLLKKFSQSEMDSFNDHTPACLLSHFSYVWLFVTPWTIAYQAPLSTEFSRQKYCSGLPFPSPEDLPDPGTEPKSPASQSLAGRFFATWFFLWSCVDVRVELRRRLSTEELLRLNCGVGEDSWESLGLQGDPTSPFWRRSTLGFLWKEWC